MDEVDQYIFGYGSLISSESRQRSGESGKSVPVVIDGLQRAWNLNIEDPPFTAVGAVEDLEDRCNGVIVPVEASELPNFDEREVPYGYTRKEVKIEDVTVYTGDKPEGKIWVYISDNPGAAVEKMPIIQSYVDVIMTGCLEVGEQAGIGDRFAKDFIQQTKGWDGPWINDRKNPIYMGAMTDVPRSGEIDQILQQEIPDAYSKRREI